MAVYTLEIQLQGIDELTPVLNRAEEEVRAAADGIESSLKKVEDHLQDLGETGEESLERVSASMGDVGKKIRGVGDELRPVGFALAGVGAALLGPIAVGTTRLADFERQMNLLRASSELTDEEFEQLRQTALELGSGPFTAQKVAEGMVALARSGYDAEQSMKAIGPTLNLAAATGMQLDDVVKTVALTVRGMGVGLGDTARVADVMAEAAIKTSVDVQGLGNAFYYVAPLATKAGFSLEEMSAAIGMVSDAGLEGRWAGMGLHETLRALLNPTRTQSVLMRRLGLQIYDTQGNMLPLVSIVAQLEKALGGMSQKQRYATQETLFGAAGARVMSAIIQQGSGRLDELTKSLEGATGATAKMAEQTKMGLSGSFKSFGNSLNAVAMQIATTFEPVIKAVVDALTRMLETFNKLPGPVKTTIAVVLGLVGALAAVAGAAILFLSPLGLLIQGLANLPAAIAAVQAILAGLTGGVVGNTVAWVANMAAMTAHRVAMLAASAATAVMTAAQWALNVALSANPIGILILAIAALIAAGIALWKNWDKLVGFFTAAWEGIKRTVGVVVGFIKDHWQEIATVLALFVGGPLAALAVAFATNAFGIRETVGNLVESVKAFFADLAGSALDMGKRIISGLWEGISNSVGGLLENVKNVGGNILDAMKSGLGKLWPFSPSEAGVDIGEGLVQGISAGVRNAQEQLDGDLAGIERKVTEGSRGLGAGREVAFAGAGTTGAMVVNGPLVAFYDVQVRSDRDLDEIARRTARELGNVRRGMT